MSVHEYIQKQDKTFDTFRSTFSLGPASPLRVDSRLPTQSIKEASTSSIPSLRDILMQGPDDDTEVKETATPMRFLPQMRKLEAAPWEDGSVSAPVTTASTAQDDNTEKSRKNRRTGLFSRFKRATSSTGTPIVGAKETMRSAPVAPNVKDLTSFGAHERSPTTLAIPKTDMPSPSGQVVKPLGKVIDEGDTDTHAVEGLAIAFQPISPSIVRLRRPVSVAPLERPKPNVISSGEASPRLEYEPPTTSNDDDRMSRMFDNLDF